MDSCGIDEASWLGGQPDGKGRNEEGDPGEQEDLVGGQHDALPL